MINWKRHLYGLPIFKPYRLFRTWQISKQYKKVPEGFLFSSYPSMLEDGWELEIRKAMDTLLDRTDVVVDVGANTGFYSMLAAHRGKKAIAVEPDPGNLLILKANLRRQSNKHLVSVYAGILSDKTGDAILYGDGDMASSRADWQGVSKYFRTRIKSTTLDTLIGANYLYKQLLIKIDVEGDELRVLQGAKSILKRAVKPVFVLETMPTTPTGNSNSAYDAVFEIMNNYGYNSSELSNHNFLFTPRPTQAVSSVPPSDDPSS